MKPLPAPAVPPPSIGSGAPAGKRWRRLLWRGIRSFVVPLIVSAGWAFWNMDSQSFGVKEFVKSFSGSFFFLMWLASQFARISRSQLDDDRHDMIVKEIQGLGTRLNDAMNGGATAALAEDPAVARITDAGVRALVEEARTAISSGATLSGVLVMATAFELAVRQRAGANHAPFRPTRVLLEGMRDTLPPGVPDDLLALLRLRNDLVHLREVRALSHGEASQLFQQFLLGIVLLSPAEATAGAT